MNEICKARIEEEIIGDFIIRKEDGITVFNGKLDRYIEKYGTTPQITESIGNRIKMLNGFNKIISDLERRHF